MRKRQKLLTGFAILLLMVAAFAWLSYVVQAIGYSAMPPSVQQQNSSVKFHAFLAFGIAVALEGFAAGFLAWQYVLTENGTWWRLGVAMGIGVIADFLTYAVIHTV